jgi:hypothetical protein
MNHVAITIQTTDNRTVAFGYDPKFYKDETQRNADIVKDLRTAKKAHGKKIGMVMIAEWETGKPSNGIVYENINEAIKTYAPKKTAETPQWTNPDGTPEKD